MDRQVDRSSNGNVMCLSVSSQVRNEEVLHILSRNISPKNFLISHLECTQYCVIAVATMTADTFNLDPKATD